jgi:WD40 repeat protein
VQTGKEIRLFEADARFISEVAFSPDKHTIASGSAEGPIVLWDAETGKAIRSLLDGTEVVTTVAFSPDGRWIATNGAGGTVMIWDVQTVKPITTITGHTNIVTSVAISPDGRLVTSGSYDGSILLWDMHAGKQTLAIRCEHGSRAHRCVLFGRASSSCRGAGVYCLLALLRIHSNLGYAQTGIEICSLKGTQALSLPRYPLQVPLQVSKKP